MGEKGLSSRLCLFICFFFFLMEGREVRKSETNQSLGRKHNTIGSGCTSLYFSLKIRRAETGELTEG